MGDDRGCSGVGGGSVVVEGLEVGLLLLPGSVGGGVEVAGGDGGVGEGLGALGRVVG